MLVLFGHSISNKKLDLMGYQHRSSAELGEFVSRATYHVHCWMTMAQINKIKSNKVLFSEFK